MLRILKETDEKFPFEWANIDSYRDSKAYRKEIYLKKQDRIIDDLISLFYYLFGNHVSNIVVFDKSWWDYCLDTWNFEKDEYDYSLEDKSIETQDYLSLLIESQIQSNYSGCCSCSNWKKFLKITLNCLMSHKAPYSPIFCDKKNDYFFYFHESGSIGIYYKDEKNLAIEQILLKSYQSYIVEN